MELLVGGNGPVMRDALAKLIRPAENISLAVSYLQVSGWDLLRPFIAPAVLGSTRVLCDDRMGITNPEAVRRMQSAGIDVRAYVGSEVYHPKVFLARKGGEGRALLGSANLSEPALLSSIEAGVVLDDAGEALGAWFDHLFENRSAVFDDDRMARLEQAFRKRLKSDLAMRRTLSVTYGGSGSALVDRIFSALGDYIAPLSFDQGKNNVRSLEKAWELTRSVPASWSEVQEAELRFSGMAEAWALTPLGQSIAQANTLDEVVQLWASWLKNTPAADLPARQYDNLAVAQQSFAAFWRMQPDVRNFFLDRSIQNDAADRPMLQAIELLANASPVGEDLSIDEIATLAPLLTDPSKFPSNVLRSVRTYIENKAARTWGMPERRLILEGWRDA